MMMKNWFFHSLGLLFALFLMACSTPVVNGPVSNVVDDQNLELRDYTAVELVGVSNNVTVDSDFLSILFKLHRSALMNIDSFEKVNGLRRYPHIPEEIKNTVLIVPTVTQFDIDRGIIHMHYALQDKATGKSLGAFDLEADGGELSINAAIQRLVLNFEEVIGVSVMATAQS
jgi:hypothetical protein